MNSIFIFTLLVFIVRGQLDDDAKSVNPIGCGRRENFQRNKIVGGTPAQVGDWGWMVGLNQHNTHFCGGVLINSQWILSAAHCFYGFANPYLYKANIGYYFRDSPEQWSVTREISKIILHEQYDSATYANDIVLLKLNLPVSYNNYIVPACIPDTQVDYSGQTSWSTGWGNTFVSENSNELLQVALPVLTDYECSVRFPNLNSSTGFCVGYEGLGQDTCEGDSGGPLVVKSSNGKNSGDWTVAGIISYGYSCGDGTVVARVSSYYDWIIKIIENN